MARHVVAATMLVSTLLGLGRTAEAQDLDGISEDTVTAAREANVPLIDLLGAVATTNLPGRQYLIAVGELAPAEPPPLQGPPYGSAVARAKCVIGKESGGADVPNRQGSGAQG